MSSDKFDKSKQKQPGMGQQTPLNQPGAGLGKDRPGSGSRIPGAPTGKGGWGGTQTPNIPRKEDTNK